MDSLSLFAEFQRGLPLWWGLTWQLATASHAGEAISKLSLAEGSERRASIKRRPGPEVCEELLVGAKPFHQSAAFFLRDHHFCQRYAFRVRKTTGL